MYLPVQVALINNIVVDDADSADTSGDQVLRAWASEATGPHD